MKKTRSILLLIFMCAVAAMSYPTVALFNDPLNLLIYLGVLWCCIIAAMLIWTAKSPKA